MAYLKPWEPGITLHVICLVSVSRRVRMFLLYDVFRHCRAFII